MNIRYTRHAIRRMQQRRISAKDVIDVVESPDEIDYGEYGETIAVKYYGTRIFKVVYEESDADTYVIITVMSARYKV